MIYLNKKVYDIRILFRIRLGFLEFNGKPFNYFFNLIFDFDF